MNASMWTQAPAGGPPAPPPPLLAQSHAIVPVDTPVAPSGPQAMAMQAMMMPQAMAAQQMYMQQCMMMQTGQPALDTTARAAAPPVVVTKKGAEYHRLMKKGDNQETVFVGGLRKTSDEDQIAAHFAKFGQVEKVDLKRQPDGTSRGFAFVRFAEAGAIDKVMDARSKHMIDNKWIDVKKHSGVAACAGRAQALTKDSEPKAQDDADEADPDDLEEKWTNQYLTMAQKMQQNFGELGDVGEEEEPETPVALPMMQPMMQPMAMMPPMMQPMAMGGQTSQESSSQEPLITGLMTLSPSVLAQMGISGGPPGLIIAVPILANGQPAVPIPGMSSGPAMMMQQGAGTGMQGHGSFGPAAHEPGPTMRSGPFG